MVQDFRFGGLLRADAGTAEDLRGRPWAPSPEIEEDFTPGHARRRSRGTFSEPAPAGEVNVRRPVAGIIRGVASVSGEIIPGSNVRRQDALPVEYERSLPDGTNPPD